MPRLVRKLDRALEDEVVCLGLSHDLENHAGRLDACDWCVPSFVRSRRKATTSAARMLCSGFAEAINLYICTLVNISSQLQLRHIQPVPV